VSARCLALLAALSAPFGGGAFAQAPIVVGAVVSQTGLARDLATDYRKGILLWQAQVAAAGGLIGRPVEVRLADDGSGADEAAIQYQRMIGENKVDLLVGPYGSAASLVSAAVAERARRVMVNGSGASGSVHKRGLHYVFQVATPYARYGAGVLDVAGQWNAGKLFVIARADPVAREMADALATEAARRRVAASAVVTFKSDTEEFDAFVRQAKAQDARAWVAFGSARDAANMVISFKRLGYSPSIFVARGAESPGFIRRVGQDAEYAIGISAWEPGLRTHGNDAFVQAYREKWGSDPGLAAAQAYSACRVLEAAVRRAGSVDQEKLRAALAQLDVETPLGRYRTQAGTGQQIGMQTILIQIQKGRREIVWPARFATASVALPYPRWDQRMPITAEQ
jgi:branched-chain amino acid transport system substrate-binding protein